MKKKIKYYGEYILYKLINFIFIITPNFLLKPILILFAKLLNKYGKYRNEIIQANLDLVFHDKITQKHKEEIRYLSYKSFIFNMYEFIENQNISKEKLFKKAKLENEHYIVDAIKNNKKVIFITAHYGGWEITIPYLALKLGKLAVVSRKMDNLLINKLFVKGRNKNKITMIDKKVAAKGMIKALKHNCPIALAIDQHIKSKLEIEFFKKKVLATDSTSRLALKFDALIIPVFSIMNDFRDYTLKIYEPIDPKKIAFKSENKIEELTKIQYEIIEKQIKQRPELWFWQHKRWKYFHNNIYERAENQ